ncbi:MAG TPA: sulfatase-like hydrolase/transferase, partial [Vicinamibacterales bacterium]|nr:sulfatase-like hydrolase/transferase [Vicinamibacterales bacterium]
MSPAGFRASVGRLTALLACLVLTGACGRAARGPANVLIVTLDTLRADRVGVYGYAAARTPVLDGLAAKGARFTSATTTTPLTLSAHTSLFTGMWPTAHGIRDNTGFYVDGALTTLAEQLKGQGYRTGGFVGAFVLDARWGIAQGFDHYFDDFDLTEDVGPGLDAIQRRGAVVVDAATAWLTEPATTPFFAWVHLYDPHTPYDAPAEYAAKFPATRDGAYDAEVAYTDTQLGRLLSALDAGGRLENTIVVVMADHGEQLGEHREQSHGFFIYDAAVQVPLIVVAPGVAPRVVPDQVRVIDVMPTVLDLAGVAIPAAVQGTSLRPALEGERQSLLAFSESWYPRFHYGWSELRAVRDGRYKFIQAPRRELYDVNADPHELNNLAASDPARADALERSLRALVAQTSRADAATGPQPVDAAAEQRLRALGYVGGASAKNLEERPRRDPKDAIELYNLLQLAGSDSEAGRYDEAAAKVQQALAVDPDIIEAYSRLGNIYTKADKHAEAAAAYRQALTLDPEHLLSTYNLALSYRALGKIDEAIVGFERTQQLDPRSGRANFQLGDIYMQRGEPAKALEVLQNGLTLEVDRAPFLVKLAEAHLELKQIDQAEAALNEAIRLRPDVPRGQYNLALILEQRGRGDQARAAYEVEATRNPKNYGAQFNLAKLLQQQGRLADATARYRAAVEARPEFAEGYLYLAKALLDGGDLRGAEQAAQDG